MSDIFAAPVAQLGASTFTLGQLLLAGGALLFGLMVLLVARPNGTQGDLVDSG
ncbi:hypothetical protein LC061_21095 [Nitratireductor aquimarinus]|nr:hypothetical protein [Nitratireductor aquimarinus]MCA1263231.1 hypothetical protein [Nitratireductor aquimarinus]